MSTTNPQPTALCAAATPASTVLARFAALTWSLDSLADNNAWRTDSYWVSERAKHHRYSFRMLRYWYMERLLASERVRLGRPLAVLEIGVDRGQMKAFVDGASSAQGTADSIYSTWDAADIRPQREALTAAGYGNCHTTNLDDAGSLHALAQAQRGKYDVVIVLHVLEHLTEPARAVKFLGEVLGTEGIMLGGFPVIPTGLVNIRERQLKKSAQQYGHVSAFSKRRVQRMASDAGLGVDYASGAFAVRASGSPLEHRAWWLRLNIAFGALLPSWPGEIYWQLRKLAPRLA